MSRVPGGIIIEKERIESSEKLYNIVDQTFKKTTSKLDNAVDFLELGLDAFFLVPNYLLDKFGKSGNYILNKIESSYDNHGRFMRTVAQPWSYIFLIINEIYWNRKIRQIPLLAPGIHFIRGNVGGGKSLTSFILAEMTLEMTGHPSYMTAKVEKPQLSEDGSYWYVMHPVIDVKSYYKKGKKIKRYNGHKYPYMHKDERHLEYNPRLNKKNSYNDTFVPEHADELVMRHDGFKAIYKYSQHIKLDGQEAETINMVHIVSVVKGVPRKKWLKDGKYDRIPTKLKFTSYHPTVELNGEYSLKKYKTWSMPVPYEVLERYDTHAERNRHSHLPIDFK